MAKIKKAKLQGAPFAKQNQRIRMARTRHRSMLTQLDAARVILRECTLELEALYADVNPRPAIVKAVRVSHGTIMGLLESMEAHSQWEYPEGIPDTV